MPPEALGTPWVTWVGYVLVKLGVLGISISIGIAILKYRLYEIDTLINRTLVYGALTVLLAVVYFGGVTATEAVFRTLTGQLQQPQLAVVISTLVIAALFIPLRRRIQSFKDRRFYRRKYDVRKTLENFSAKPRDGPRGTEQRTGGSGEGDDAACACVCVVAPRYCFEG